MKKRYILLILIILVGVILLFTTKKSTDIAPQPALVSGVVSQQKLQVDKNAGVLEGSLRTTIPLPVDPEFEVAARTQPPRLMCHDNGNGTVELWWQYRTGWFIFKRWKDGPHMTMEGQCHNYQDATDPSPV